MNLRARTAFRKMKTVIEEIKKVKVSLMIISVFFQFLCLLAMPSANASLLAFGDDADLVDLDDKIHPSKIYLSAQQFESNPFYILGICRRILSPYSILTEYY